MKSVHIFLFLCVALLLSVPAHSAKKDSLLNDFDHFSSQKGMVLHKGYFNVYQLGEQYFLEIPKESLDKNILVTTQVVKGLSAYVSDASTVVNFSKGKGNSLYLMTHYSLDALSDSTDACLMNAISKSGMRPIDNVYPLVAMGPSKRSYIIDISKDLNTANGLFNVSSNSSLSHPDPMSSGVDGVRMFSKGVVFQVTRNQVDLVPVNQDGKKMNVASTYGLEFVFEQLPETYTAMKEAQPAFGFDTITRTEYSSKEYMARQMNYIQRWRLSASKADLVRQRKGIAIEPIEPIVIYIDPVTPKPFVESIRQSIAQWSDAFSKSGWKNVFHISSDNKDASLTYRHILIRWGCAYAGLYSNKVIDPISGEILAARINVTDADADERLQNYYLQCGEVDSRIANDLHCLDVRKDILTAQVASELGKVLGLKPNYAANTVFTLQQIRSEKWLQQYGLSASVTAPLVYNILARPSDGIDVKNLLPRVSVYDWEAIRYAYSNGALHPSMKAAFYSAEDKLNPYTQVGFLSNDVMEANLSCIEQLKHTYANLNANVSKLPEDQNKWETVSDLSIKAMVLYQNYLTNINALIGGMMKHPIIKGVSENLYTFVPREQQVDALKYMENTIFTEMPQWVKNKQLMQASGYDFNDMMMGLAVAMYKHYIDKNVIQSLITAEYHLGDKAFTTKDLFIYLNRVFFENFNSTKAVSTYKQHLQVVFISDLARTVAQNNISTGLANEANNVLHTYFIDIANKIIELSKTHVDESTRANYLLMVMRMNREYFNKQQ